MLNKLKSSQSTISLLVKHRKDSCVPVMIMATKTIQEKQFQTQQHTRPNNSMHIIGLGNALSTCVLVIRHKQ
jgi:hypothetical protein